MNPVNYSGRKTISTPALVDYLVRFFRVGSRVQSRCDRGIDDEFATLVVEGHVLRSFSGHLKK